MAETTRILVAATEILTDPFTGLYITYPSGGVHLAAAVTAAVTAAPAPAAPAVVAGC